MKRWTVSLAIAFILFLYSLILSVSIAAVITPKQVKDIFPGAGSSGPDL